HNLYLAIQVEQAELQPRVLAQGLQFGINRSGKKEEDLSIRFPVVDRLALRELMKQEMDERPDDYRVAALKQVKGIEVKGFEHLLDGMLSLNNQYGIRAGAQLNDGMDLLFIEIQIPLRHLNLSGKQQSSELAFNLLVGAPAVTGPRSGEDGAQ